MVRRKILAGNWKMNKTSKEVKGFLEQYLELLKAEPSPDEVELIIAPSLPFLAQLKSGSEGFLIKIAGQTCHQNLSGAFTGEVSAAMLASVGCDYVLVGHSERRKYFSETDELVNLKVKSVLEASLSPIICIGETLDERKSGRHFSVVQNQVLKALAGLISLQNIVLAYEPVWAIGTGETASPDQAEEVHLFIRNLLVSEFGNASLDIPLLYGGSCNLTNAKELFSCPNIDGGLIGGASLKADEFYEMSFCFS